MALSTLSGAGLWRAGGLSSVASLQTTTLPHCSGKCASVHPSFGNISSLGEALLGNWRLSCRVLLLWSIGVTHVKRHRLGFCTFWASFPEVPPPPVRASFRYALAAWAGYITRALSGERHTLFSIELLSSSAFLPFVCPIHLAFSIVLVGFPSLVVFKLLCNRALLWRRPEQALEGHHCWDDGGGSCLGVKLLWSTFPP